MVVQRLNIYLFEQSDFIWANTFKMNKTRDEGGKK